MILFCLICRLYVHGGTDIREGFLSSMWSIKLDAVTERINLEQNKVGQASVSELETPDRTHANSNDHLENPHQPVKLNLAKRDDKPPASDFSACCWSLVQQRGTR